MSLTKLATAKDGDVSRLGVDHHSAAVRGRDASTSEQASVLIHVQRRLADSIGIQESLAQVVHEAERR
jgi:hypothetical protein